MAPRAVLASVPSAWRRCPAWTWPWPPPRVEPCAAAARGLDVVGDDGGDDAARGRAGDPALRHGARASPAPRAAHRLVPRRLSRRLGRCSRSWPRRCSIVLQRSGALAPMTMDARARAGSRRRSSCGRALPAEPAQGRVPRALPQSRACSSPPLSAGPRGRLAHGRDPRRFCLGCCWLLMALLFVGGVMNLAWIALLSCWSRARSCCRAAAIAWAAGAVSSPGARRGAGLTAPRTCRLTAWRGAGRRTAARLGRTAGRCGRCGCLRRSPTCWPCPACRASSWIAVSS